MNKKNRPVIPETVENKNNKINKECAGMKKFKDEEIIRNIEDKMEFRLDSREVAEMMEVEHKYVLQYIEGNKTRNIIGIIPTLESSHINYQKYFIKSNYKAGTRQYKCYLISKLGCELLGSKQQGAKGILFSAKYVERFNEMENKLKGIENNPPQKVSEVSREEFNNLKNTVDTLTSIVNTLTQVTNTLTNVIANNQDIPKPQEEEKERVKSNPVIIRRDKNDNPNKKEVVAIVFENNKPVVISKYDSQTIASKEIGLGRHTISKCCNGNHKTSLKDNYNRAVYLYNLEDFEIEYPSVKIKRKI